MELYLERLVNKNQTSETQWIRFPLKEDEEYFLGRLTNKVVVRLLSTHVSRIHGSLSKVNGIFYIKDSKSLNGIHVNDQRIPSDKRHRLNAGDMVEIGRPPKEDQLDITDRFVYIVKSSCDLDTKPKGVDKHSVSENTLKKMMKNIKQDPQPSTAHVVDKVRNKVTELIDTPSSFNSSKSKHPDSSSSGIESSQEKSQNENFNLKSDVKSYKDSCSECHNEVKQSPKKRCMSDQYEMEQENKRLKMELKIKEEKFLKELELKEKKVKEEREKIAQKLEEEFKTQLEQKKEELEMRLQLEKDIAVEQCKAETKPEKAFVDAMENELQCSVCSELFIKAVTLNCSHTFCEYCIYEWKKVKTECPVCRKSIQSLTRSLALDNYINKVMESVSDSLREQRSLVVAERQKLSTSNPSAATRGRGRGRDGPSRGRGIRRLPRVDFRPIIILSDSDSSSDSSSSFTDSDPESLFSAVMYGNIVTSELSGSFSSD